VFDLNVDYPLDEELPVEELEMDAHAPENADKLDEDDFPVVEADELDHFAPRGGCRPAAGGCRRPRRQHAAYLHNVEILGNFHIKTII
jgi:hypothetical protein